MADIVNNHTAEIRLNAVEAKSRCGGQRNLMAMCLERFPAAITYCMPHF
jgi:hypothetical protein